MHNICLMLKFFFLNISWIKKVIVVGQSVFVFNLKVASGLIPLISISKPAFFAALLQMSFIFSPFLLSIFPKFNFLCFLINSTALAGPVFSVQKALLKSFFSVLHYIFLPIIAPIGIPFAIVFPKIARSGYTPNFM